MKKTVSDLMCAFAIYSIVLVSITLLINAEFFKGSFSWDSERTALTLFDKRITFDRQIVQVLNRMLEFNDVFFGKGFSKSVKYAVGAFSDFAADFLSLSYNLAKDVTGVR